MKKFRHVLFWGLGLASVALLWGASPAGFEGPVKFMGLDALTMFLVMGLALLLVKLWHPYKEADSQTLYRAILEGDPGSTGAGLALVAKAILVAAVIGAVSGKVHAAERIPLGFLDHGPTLADELHAYWPGHPARWVMAGLVEQESCPRCWNPKSRLKTAREEGAGMGQLTRAYRADGSLRFDTLSDLRRRYPGPLGPLSWQNVYDRPDLQLRAMVLLSLENHRAFDHVEGLLQMVKLQFTDAAYNAGAARIKRDIVACNLSAGCDPKEWFGHVERTCTASKAPIYGGRSACDITREHVSNVFRVRGPKYVGLI